MLWMLLTACGLKSLLPEGPALSAAARAALTEGPSGATYTGPARTSVPVLPVVVWGAAYDLDLVLVSAHPTWNMHEYARLQTPDGPLWIAKDARESTMSQSIVTGLPDVHAWLPELPIETRSSPVQVMDRSTDDWLDLELTYVNIDGEPVRVTYEGRVPRSEQRKRNGSTMGHSRDSLLAVLDLPLRDLGRRATIQIAGERVRIERILGLVPFRMALVQTQGGLASGTLRQVPPDGEGSGEGAPHGFQTFHGGREAPVDWAMDRAGPDLIVRQATPIRTLTYRFRRGEAGAAELVEARVDQFGREVPATRVVFSPSLPDLARPFTGRVAARFAIDVNGQEGHATGTVVAWWEGGEPRLRVVPEAPWWATDRPLLAHIRFEGGQVHTTITVDRDEPSATGAAQDGSGSRMP